MLFVRAKKRWRFLIKVAIGFVTLSFCARRPEWRPGFCLPVGLAPRA
jgi:hypothetical protein